MLRRLYDWTMARAADRHAEKALAGISFAESSFLPVPPDLLLIPMVLAERTKAVRYATVCTVASVLGGIAGYLIGAFLFNELARPILDLYGHRARFDAFAGWYNDWGTWVVFTAGLTPFPYKVVTIASGAAGLLMIAGAGLLDGLLGLPAALLRGAGLVLVPYVAFVVLVATRGDIARPAVWSIIAANVLWAAASGLLLASGWVAPTALGYAFVIELLSLNGRERLLPTPVVSILRFE